MKKICFITATRSEYGLLKWLMKEVDESSEFQLQLVVTGGHLVAEQGHTIDQIISDGFIVDTEVDSKFGFETKEIIAASMGRMAEGMAHAFANLTPDYIVVLGDRYELLPICNTAFVMNIPIIHISGGDVTEGAIDDGIRNAVTMLATYHFPESQESAGNIIRMRGTDKNVWVVGTLGLDLLNHVTLMNRSGLAEELGLDEHKNWVLMTYHPETKRSMEYNIKTVENCCSALMNVPDIQVVATYANLDYGGKAINDFLENVKMQYPYKLCVIPSLGNYMYLSLMKQVIFVIGNSSSGIFETPSLGVHAINIGERQKGRHLCSNIIQCESSEEMISKRIKEVRGRDVDTSDMYYWGDGHTAEKIIEILKNTIA